MNKEEDKTAEAFKITMLRALEILDALIPKMPPDEYTSIALLFVARLINIEMDDSTFLGGAEKVNRLFEESKKLISEDLASDDLLAQVFRTVH